jgi:hypothetical protein
VIMTLLGSCSCLNQARSAWPSHERPNRSLTDALARSTAEVVAAFRSLHGGANRTSTCRFARSRARGLPKKLSQLMSRRQTRLRYDAFVAAAHVHPAQTETQSRFASRAGVSARRFLNISAIQHRGQGCV